MNSTSSTSRSSKALAVVALLFLWVGTAAAGRKRVCVLDFEGPNAEKFHEDLVKLLKKSHTVVSVDKWNAKAEELDAGKVTEKNVKKIAKKLKVDGVITGKVEKRRDEYIIRLKLRSGTTGEILGNSVQTKADGPRLDGQAQRDIKEELIGAIDELESNREGGDDEEAETPKGKKGNDEEEDGGGKKSGFSRKNKDEEESESATSKVEKAAEEKKKKDEEKKAAEDKKAEEKDRKAEEKKKKDDDKKKKDEDEEKAALSTKKDEGSEEEEDRPKKHEKAHKKKASSDEEGNGEEEGVEESAEVDTDHELNVSPSRRAIDAVVGLSFTARRLNFKYASDLGKPPPGYKQSIPVAGALLDMTFYPLSFSHKPSGIISGLGLNILYDQVLKINSQKKYPDQMGNLVTADLATSESRFGVGAVLRYPLGEGPKAIVVGGKLSYQKQKFTVAQKLPNNDPTDIPNVAYTILSPAVFIQAPVIPKVVLNGELAFLAVTNTGDIQLPTQYGAATVTGYEINLGGDYMIMKSVFVRAEIRYQSFGFTFKGDPMSMTNTRDTDPDQDVQGAKDTYFGGAATVGYVY